jgi:hypothetical protein
MKLNELAVGLINNSGLPHTQATSSTITTVFNLLLSIMGAITFLILVIAGLRYVVSEGDPTKVAESRRMIIYSLVGLVVIASATAIVNFALKIS